MNQKATCPHCRTSFQVSSELYNTIVSCPGCAVAFNPMQELTKAAWEMTRTPKFQALLTADIAEANKDITHADFVAGVQNRIMGYKCIHGDPYQFIRGARRIIFSILVMLYMVAPLILVPLWAWHEGNWWLLIGIVISFIATRVAASLTCNQKKANSIGGILLITSIGFWFRFGIHNHYAFFTLCALWGLMLFMMADNCENEYALQSLVENPNLFNDAIAQNKIMIVRK